MKKIVLIIISHLFLITTAYADICYDIRQEIADKAEKIIKKHDTLYSYCSICPQAKVQKINVKEVENSNPIKVNGNPIDLAHIYYKNGNKYINLGIKSGCIKDGEYYILSELNDLPEIHHTKENDKMKAKMQAQEIFEECVNVAENMKHETTLDMISQNTKINDCLEEAVNNEIKKGFEIKQQKNMKNYVKQLRNATYNFYYGVYTENKYCYGSCGTITSLLPYADEGNALTDLLESLLYLNIAKDGY